MSRVKRGTMHVKHRRNILKHAKGYRWGRKSKIKLARVAVLKAGVYAYRDRRAKKREARKLWQIKINAGAHIRGTKYSALMRGLRTKGVVLDRKILAELAEQHPLIFEKVVSFVT